MPMLGVYDRVGGVTADIAVDGAWCGVIERLTGGVSQVETLGRVPAIEGMTGRNTKEICDKIAAMVNGDFQPTYYPEGVTVDP